jgi:hypothetical protein
LRNFKRGHEPLEKSLKKRALRKCPGILIYMSLLGKKCQDIWNKPGGLMDPSGLFFQGLASALCISCGTW